MQVLCEEYIIWKVLRMHGLGNVEEGLVLLNFQGNTELRRTQARCRRLCKGPAALLCCGGHTGASNLRPVGHVQPRMAVHAAQHTIVHLLKTL